MQDERLLKSCQAAEADYINMWERLVNIDTGSRYGVGINKVAAIVAEEFRKLGARVQVIPTANPEEGSHVLVTFTGKGKGKVFAMAHMDTVFPEGTVKERPFTIKDGWVRGPGVSDCKGSVNLILFAMKQLKKLNYTDFAQYTFLFNCDEEIGSPNSHLLIQKLAPQHDYTLCCEPGQVGDGVVKYRKGSSNIILEVQGVASHAGSNPEAGRNAIMEIIHQIQEMSRLGDPAKQTTVNFTTIKAGDRTNVIPDYAIAKADMRVMFPEEIDRVEKAAQEIAMHHVIADTTVKVTVERSNPPFAENPGTDKLIKVAQEVYGELDKKLVVIGAGGASDANWAASAGAIAIDGMGPVKGGKNHTPQECTKLDSVVPRMYLLARMLMVLGHGLE